MYPLDPPHVPSLLTLLVACLDGVEALEDVDGVDGDFEDVTPKQVPNFELHLFEAAQ